MKRWPKVKLAEIAPIIRRPVEIEIEKSYPELGIRSFGKGTFHKASLSGAEVGSKRLFSIEPGDLMFSNVFAWEGAVAVAKQEDHGRFGSHRFITCAVDLTKASPEFLRCYFTASHLARIFHATPLDGRIDAGQAVEGSQSVGRQRIQRALSCNQQRDERDYPCPGLGCGPFWCQRAGHALYGFQGERN